MKSEDVVRWREALVRLSDQHFFELMRMYLGAIRTPFNKQKLVEELSAFLRKKETKDRVVVNLDGFDRMVIAAIRELSSPTQARIVSFFSGTKSFPEIYERILNLEERLVIYRKADENNREYAINPLLADELAPYAGLSFLVSPDSVGEPESAPLRVDDITLAALYSFFLHAGDAMKSDGSLRKKTLGELKVVFPQIASDADSVGFLLAALQNLGLLARIDDRFVPDPAKWAAFARLSPMARLAWLVSSAGGRRPQTMIRDGAQAFLDFFAFLDTGGRYHPDAVSRLAAITEDRLSRVGAARAASRFSSLIKDSDRPDSEPSSGLDCVKVAIAFGALLEKDGRLVKNASLDAPDTASARESRPFIVVAPTLEVTLLPGFTLAELLPLAQCLEARSVQITGQFEISRKSCGVAFDQGVDAEGILSLFRSLSPQPLPQNVEFSVANWFRGWSSVSLYHGYVLRVDESRRALFENDERLSSLIGKTLAPGVYLLDAASAEAIQEGFAQADLDFIPSVASALPHRSSAEFPALRTAANPGAAGVSNLRTAAETDSSENSARARGLLREELMASLASLSVPEDVADALRSRIDRRIAIVPGQLNPDSVRVEKVEARGMDFLGKVRIAEYALTSGGLLEIELDENGEGRRILGRPVSSEKKAGDVIVKIVTEPDRSIELVSIGKAVLVRRIRGSIFSELPLARS